MNEKLSLSKDKIKILLLEGIHPRAVEVFQQQGYHQIERVPSALDRQVLFEKISNVHMIGIRSRTHLDAEALSYAKKLMAIGCFCIGTNQVDLETTADRGIPVFNAPHSNTRSVAELVIGQTIMLMRNIFPKSMAAHRGEWQKSASASFEVRGKTLGIVGYGHIGSQVSVLAEALGMKVVYFDIQSKLPLGNAVSLASLKDLLAASDVVTLHVPATDQTKGMISTEELAQMRPGASLINASRGNVVDLEALANALSSNHLKGAAIDVFPKEPSSNKLPFDSPLKGLEQVILSPHIGGSTLEAQENIGTEVGHRLAFFSDRGTTEGAVNLPQVNLAAHRGTHRILHFHTNQPGMLSQINAILGKNDINVTGQHLGTKNHIGFVVLDVVNAGSREVLRQVRHQLGDIPGTIRTRLLY